MNGLLALGDNAIIVDGKGITCASAGTDTSDATITSGAQILYPYTGYANGLKYEGSIQSKSAQTYVPTTTNQTIGSGQYLSGTQTILGDSNLVASNIKNGVVLFENTEGEITGTYKGEIVRLITNDNSITPTGTYATSTYYNTSYGVKIGYTTNGDIILSMQGGTSTSYEYLNFVKASFPDGVTLKWNFTTSSNYATGKPSIQYACVISGLTQKSQISLVMDTLDATYDYASVKITITPNS